MSDQDEYKFLHPDGYVGFSHCLDCAKEAYSKLEAQAADLQRQLETAEGLLRECIAAADAILKWRTESPTTSLQKTQDARDNAEAYLKEKQL